MSLWLGTLGGQVTAPATVSVEYLVVAGGGAGGYANSTKGYGGGGGAGGYLSSLTGEQFDPGPESPLVADIGQPYQVTVGAGGAASTAGASGSNSVFASVLTFGGGKGGNYTLAGLSAGLSGGSGGGGGSGGTSTNFGSGTAGQGYAGKPGGSSYGGGGGGAGGDAGTPNTSHPGGPGIATIIEDGVNYVTRSKGGGGAAISFVGTPGAANTGDGGGGGRSGSLNSGGSGAIFLKVPSAITATFSAGVVYTSYTSNGFNVYAITAAGANDTVVFS